MVARISGNERFSFFLFFRNILREIVYAASRNLFRVFLYFYENVSTCKSGIIYESFFKVFFLRRGNVFIKKTARYKRMYAMLKRFFYVIYSFLRDCVFFFFFSIKI